MIELLFENGDTCVLNDDMYASLQVFGISECLRVSPGVVESYLVCSGFELRVNGDKEIELGNVYTDDSVLCSLDDRLFRSDLSSVSIIDNGRKRMIFVPSGMGENNTTPMQTCSYDGTEIVVIGAIK